MSCLTSCNYYSILACECDHKHKRAWPSAPRRSAHAPGASRGPFWAGKAPRGEGRGYLDLSPPLNSRPRGCVWLWQRGALPAARSHGPATVSPGARHAGSAHCVKRQALVIIDLFPQPYIISLLRSCVEWRESCLYSRHMLSISLRFSARSRVGRGFEGVSPPGVVASLPARVPNF